MVSKILQHMEVLRGFIKVPAKSLSELMGENPLPLSTTLNGNPARLDKYGRLWSPFLRNKFAIGAKVELSKTENGFHVVSNEDKQENYTSEVRPQEETIPANAYSESKTNEYYRVLEGDCLNYLNDGSINNIHLTFLDPPYRQGKDYRFFDDNQPTWKYWSWLKEILHKVYNITTEGGAIYFMHREKNAEQVLRVLRKTGWQFQNLIIWKKKTSAVPCNSKFSKQYQIIAYAIKGEKPRVFNKLRIDLPPSMNTSTREKMEFISPTFGTTFES